MRSESRRGYKPTYSSLFVTTPQSASPTAPRKGAPFGAVQVRHNKPALKGEVDASVTSRRRGCIVAALVYVNPSVTAYAVPAPRKGEPFGVVLCAKIYELTLRLEQGRLTHCRSQFSLFLPVLRFAYSSTGRAQLRTSRSDRFNGVMGVARGPKGRNRNLPWPLGKKGS